MGGRFDTSYLVVDMLQGIQHSDKKCAQKRASTRERFKFRSALKKPVTDILIRGRKPWF
jgi:hypothetical protein